MDILRLLFIVPASAGQEDLLGNLQSGGHSVLTAAGLVEAVEALFVQRFDAVLLHPLLPLEGFEEFVQTLRQVERSQNLKSKTPVFLFTELPAGAGWCAASGRTDGIDGFVAAGCPGDLLRDAIARVSGSPVKNPEPQRELPIFEEETFLSSVAYDAQLVVEVINMFFADCASQIPELHHALAEKQGEALTRAAHSFKGSLSSLQAPRARACVQELETAAKAGAYQNCQPALDALRRELDVLEPLLLNLRARFDAQASPLLHCGCSPLHN